MILRELINKIGFKVDEKAFDKAEKKFVSLANKAKYVSAAAGGIAFGMVKGAAKIQSMTAQWETFLGSEEKAASMLKKIQEFSASTPFQLDDLNQGSQRLKAFGVETEDIIDTMRMLGDTAGGNAQKLDSLTRGYGKTTAKGKASMEELNMMIDAGVPILGTLADMYGKTESEIIKMASQGKISATMVTDAFKKMTAEGGQFYKGMERQSQTLEGKISTMKDNFFLLGAEIGQTLLPAVSRLTDKVTGFVQKFQGMNETARKAIVFFLLLAVSIAPTLLIVGKMIGAFGTMVVVLKKLRAGFIALKMVMATNPIILITMAVIALIAALVMLVRNFDQVKVKAREICEKIAGFFDQVKVLAVLAFQVMIKQLMLWFYMFWTWFGEKFPGIAKFVESTFNSIRGMVAALIGFWKEIFQGVFALFRGDIDGFKAHFVSAFGFLKDYFASIIDAFGGYIDLLWGWVQPIFDFLSGKFMGAIDKVRTGVKAVGDFLGFGGETAPQLVPSYGNVARPGVTNNNSRSVNVQSSIALSVPEGTPQHQQQFIRDNAERAVQAAWDRQIKSLLINSAGSEVR